ncbi:MAG: ribonuclease J [Erysipelotrichaceae bacterium]|nr:ribonuclease J [Erysipelotrichaceae bacterium]
MKDKIQLIPLGGQSEMGKSMYCLDINDHIFIIDSGFRFPESDKLGVDIIIPSFTYLEEHKDKIAAIIITHGHDDVMGGLPYLLQSVNAPVYAPSLTGDLIEQMVNRYLRHNRNVSIELDLRRVNRNASLDINGVQVEFFPVTHSIPGSVGVAFYTDAGYIVYVSEFIIDFGAPEEFRCDIQKMMEIGKKGVLALMVESSGAKHEGYTSPNHKLTNKIERIFEDSNERIIISSFAQNVFRTKEIVELTKKYKRQIVFYGRDKYDNTNSLLRIGKEQKKPVIDVPDKLLGDKEKIGNSVYDSNYVILLSGSPTRIYHDICDIIDGGDKLLKIREGDTFIVASPVLPGTEKIANKAHNGLYKTDARVYLLKNKDLFSMHASKEDINVIIQIFKPKYYIPIKGEYQHFIFNRQIALDMGIDDENIILIDNGERISFENGELLKDRDIFEIEDIMIDGSGIGDVGEKVIDDRIQLANDGVVIVGLTISKETKDIIAQTDCQTRGFVYLKDSEYVIKHVIDICEEVVGKLKEDPNIEISEIRYMMKDQSMKYIMKETGKKPVFIGVVVEI